MKRIQLMAVAIVAVFLVSAAAVGYAAYQGSMSVEQEVDSDYALLEVTDSAKKGKDADLLLSGITGSAVAGTSFRASADGLYLRYLDTKELFSDGKGLVSVLEIKFTGMHKDASHTLANAEVKVEVGGSVAYGYVDSQGKCTMVGNTFAVNSTTATGYGSEYFGEMVITITPAAATTMTTMTPSISMTAHHTDEIAGGSLTVGALTHSPDEATALSYTYGPADVTYTSGVSTGAKMAVLKAAGSFPAWAQGYITVTVTDSINGTSNSVTVQLAATSGAFETYNPITITGGAFLGTVEIELNNTSATAYATESVQFTVLETVITEVA